MPIVVNNILVFWDIWFYAQLGHMVLFTVGTYVGTQLPNFRWHIQSIFIEKQVPTNCWYIRIYFKKFLP
jgi:hypothetical protein